MKTSTRLFSEMRGTLLTACLLTGFANAATPAADGAFFSELLTRAKAQAAAGHRQGPPGNNMTETLLNMMELVPTATADQLAEFSALLRSAETAPQEGRLGTVPSDGPSPPPPTPPTRADIPSTKLKTPLPEIAPLARPVPSTPATDGPSFSELLARAKAQAAAGHRWGPPGNNMTETLLDMMELVPTATADQLSDLSALLQSAESAPLEGIPGTVPSGGRSPPPPTRAGIPSATAQTPLPEIAPLAPPVPSTPLPLPPFQVTPPGPERTLNTLPNLTTTESGPRAAMLYARGLEAEHRGDLSAARRFYLSAAQKGDAVAARSLGRLYDPNYLRHLVVGGLDPDTALARQWYERAVQLGDSEAEPLLRALTAR